MKLSQLGEFGLIDRIARHEPTRASTIIGIGDDCAVLEHQTSFGPSWYFSNLRTRSNIQHQNKSKKSRHKYQLVTTDALVENVHFRKKGLSFFALGQKAMVANISDISAMGGWPTHTLVTIGLPKSLTVAAIDQFYQGINQIARQNKIDIIGGDTVASPNELFVSITMLGEVEKEYLLTRSGAKVGDLILATGVFGGPAKANFQPQTSNLKTMTQEARKIAKSQIATAMIDSSDGLARSVLELAKASKVGAVIYGAEVPIAKGATLQQALHGGEEYELVFTVPMVNVPKLSKMLGKTKLSIVGEIRVPEEGVGLLTSEGTREELKKGGYEHFRD